MGILDWMIVVSCLLDIFSRFSSLEKPCNWERLASLIYRLSCWSKVGGGKTVIICHLILLQIPLSLFLYAGFVLNLLFHRNLCVSLLVEENLSHLQGGESNASGGRENGEHQRSNCSTEKYWQWCLTFFVSLFLLGLYPNMKCFCIDILIISSTILSCPTRTGRRVGAAQNLWANKGICYGH